MGNYNDFNLAFKAGKRGEDLATEQLKKLGFNVIDVSGVESIRRRLCLCNK